MDTWTEAHEDVQRQPQYRWMGIIKEEKKPKMPSRSLVCAAHSKPRGARVWADDKEPLLGRRGTIPVGASRGQPDSPTWSPHVIFTSPNTGEHSGEIQIC